MLDPLPLEYVFLEGDVNRTLDCSGRGDPEPTVHWLRNALVLPFPREHVSQYSTAISAFHNDIGCKIVIVFQHKIFPIYTMLLISVPHLS